ATSNAVFSQVTGGRAIDSQSPPNPRRTTIALVNAAKTMETAPSSANMPVPAARALFMCFLALHDEVALRIRRAVFIRPMMNGVLFVRLRPLERGSVPRIRRRRFTAESAPDEIGHKQQLRGCRGERRVGNRFVDGQQSREKFEFLEIRIAAW